MNNGGKNKEFYGAMWAGIRAGTACKDKSREEQGKIAAKAVGKLCGRPTRWVEFGVGHGRGHYEVARRMTNLRAQRSQEQTGITHRTRKR